MEFGAALTPAGPIVWCWYAGDGGRTGLVPDSNVAIRRDGNQLIYEFLLPRSILRGVPLDPGSVLGFNYIANDDDGQGYRGATEWTPGMTGTKDASLFGDLVLEK